MSGDESADEDVDWFDRVTADDGSEDDEDADWFERALAETEPSEEPTAVDDDLAGTDETATDDDDWPASVDSDAEDQDWPISGGEGDQHDDLEVNDDVDHGDDGWPASSEANAEAGEGTASEPTGSAEEWPASGQAATESDQQPNDAATDPWSTDLEPSSENEGTFDDDFASAFEGEDDGFDDETLDSDLPRLDIGIAGLDDMIQGGIPERHLIAAIGAAGTGKTTVGLQFLHHGLEHGEAGVFITLEQTRESILDTAAEWGWDFEAAEASGDLAVVDLDPVEMANSLDNIRAELPGLVEDFGADRLVLDSVSLLEMMYDDQAKRRTEVYDFTRALKDAGVTTFLTSEASGSTPYSSRFGIIEYLTDAVLILRYVRAESREARLAIEIMKIRNANHSRETKPYAITDEGITVYQQANIF